MSETPEEKTSKWKFWRRLQVNDGGKRTLERKIVKRVALITIGVCVTSTTAYQVLLKAKNDTSSIVSSSKASRETRERQKKQLTSNVGGVKSQSSGNQGQTIQKNVSKVKINYRAKQVLSAEGTNEVKTLPIGINLIGRLLNSIDTRSKGQLVKVILPYGGKHNESGGSLPPNTIIFGKPRYVGSGKKVQVNFTRGLLPDGQEIRFQAQALSPNDYSIGIEGELHGNAGGRTAALLGLTMVAGVSETLVKKEALGQGFNVTAKASLENGFYNGISKVANIEASRKASKTMNKQDYITIEAGKGLIVSLTGSYKEKNE